MERASSGTRAGLPRLGLSAAWSSFRFLPISGSVANRVLQSTAWTFPLRTRARARVHDSAVAALLDGRPRFRRLGGGGPMLTFVTVLGGPLMGVAALHRLRVHLFLVDLVVGECG